MTGTDSWSTTAATNATFDGGSGTWAEGQLPSTVNGSARLMMSDLRTTINNLIWFQYGTGDQGSGNLAVPAVYASATSFTIAGVDVTTIYETGRRVKAVGSGTGTIYGSISSSSFSTNTTVNVTWDSGSLSNETLAVSLSQVPITGKPIAASAIGGSFGNLTAGNVTVTLLTSTATLTTSGLATLASGNVTGQFNANGNASFLGATVTGNATLTQNGNATFAGVTTVSGALTLSGNTTVSGNISLTSTAGPQSTTDIGYRGAPVNTPAGNYGLVLNDAGKTIYKANDAAQTWTIPANASVAFPIGTKIKFCNKTGAINNVTIAITSDTLNWHGSSGSRTLTPGNISEALKVESTVWQMTGDIT